MSPTRAQAPDSGFEIVRIGVEQGLSQRLVYDLLEDREGYVWFATREGLNRFDGHRFTVYLHEPGDPGSIPDSKVSTLLEDADGVLWVGTLTAGLARFDRRTERFESIPVRTGNAPVRLDEGVGSIRQGRDGTLWVTTRSNNLLRLRPGEKTLEHAEATIDGRPAVRSAGQTVAIDTSGRIFTQCSAYPNVPGTLAVLDPGSLACDPIPDVPMRGLLSAAGLAPDGSLLFVAADGLVDGRDRSRVTRWNGSTRWSTVIDAFPPRDLLVDDADETWLATFEGLFVLSPDGRPVRHFVRNPADPGTLSDDRVNAVMRSRDGSIWAATHDGVTVFRPRSSVFRALRSVPGDDRSLSDPRVNAILETDDGSLWVGTSDGLNRRRPGTSGFERLRQPDLPNMAAGRQRRIWSLIDVGPNTLWVGTAGAGLHSVDRGSLDFEHVTPLARAVSAAFGGDPRQPDRNPIPFLGRDRGGRTWISAGPALVRVDSAGAFRPLGLPGNARPLVMANVLLQDRRGRYWLGNDLGLHALDPDTGRLTPVGDTGVPGKGLTGPVVWTIAESPLTPDALWVGTVGNGLNRYEPETGKFTWYTMSNGLPSNTIYGILVDDYGMLWMSTTRGIVRFHPVTGSVEQFTRHDGLHDDEFDLMAYHKGAVSGRMWFGGPTGLTEFHPDSVLRRDFAYPALVSGIDVLDTPRPGIMADGDTLRLDHDDNSVSFRFTAADLLHPDDAAYRFRLDGYDRGWRSADARVAEASYTRLPPGDYTFELQTVRPGGTEGGPVSRLHVSIVPAVWQTPWFRGLILLALAGLLAWSAGAVQRRRTRLAVEAARRELELKRLLADREERERTRLAREIHDGPIQTLYSINHRLEEATPGDVESSRRDIQDLASELRDVCEALRPALVVNLGLEAALRARIRALARKTADIELLLSFDPSCRALDESVESACFRIAEEALSNAVQHAAATRVAVAIEHTGSHVRLSIVDDGRGFDLPGDWLQLAQDRHYGLVGMRERAELAGGECRIESSQGSGTRIVVEFPHAAG